MSRSCVCGNAIPNLAVVDGKQRNLSSRKYCLGCSPFGFHNTRDLAKPRIGKEKFRRWQEKARRERKAQLVALLGGQCIACGYSRCAAAMEFHHRDPTCKRFNLADHLLRRWDEVLAEAQKCDLLCANCHRELEDAANEAASLALRARREALLMPPTPAR